MGLSETIIAAIIGALATMATAIVQILRNRAPSDSRPKKKRMRSFMAIVALMVGCVAGGYFWAELRRVSAKEEMAATFRSELESYKEALANKVAGQGAVDPEAPKAALAANGTHGSAESMVHLPPCRLADHTDEVGPVACSEAVAMPVALCALVPASAHTVGIRLNARVPGSESPWLDREAGAATLGNLHIAPDPVEYPASADKRSVCLSVANFGVDETLAVRLVVEYEFATAPKAELTASAPSGLSL